MNNARVAAALNTISLAFGELAEAIADAPGAAETAQDDPGGSRLEKWAVTQEPSPFVDLPDEVFAAPSGSLEVCPKHHVAYTDGQYGKYCQQPTDDPAWGKQKGDRLWCRITPKNAAEWLRITAAA
jgi:hypothetical protein